MTAIAFTAPARPTRRTIAMKTTNTTTTAAALHATVKRLGRVLADLEALTEDPNASTYRRELNASLNAVYDATAAISVEYAKAAGTA